MDNRKICYCNCGYYYYFYGQIINETDVVRDKVVPEDNKKQLNGNKVHLFCCTINLWDNFWPFPFLSTMYNVKPM